MKREKAKGYYSMAAATIDELRGKTEAEIFEMFNKRTDKVLEKERSQINVRSQTLSRRVSVSCVSERRSLGSQSDS